MANSLDPDEMALYEPSFGSTLFAKLSVLVWKVKNVKRKLNIEWIHHITALMLSSKGMAHWTFKWHNTY